MRVGQGVLYLGVCYMDSLDSDYSFYFLYGHTARTNSWSFWMLWILSGINGERKTEIGVTLGCVF
jgi:hypothetical protein